MHTGKHFYPQNKDNTVIEIINDTIGCLQPIVSDLIMSSPADPTNHALFKTIYLNMMYSFSKHRVWYPCLEETYHASFLYSDTGERFYHTTMTNILRHQKSDDASLSLLIFAYRYLYQRDMSIADRLSFLMTFSQCHPNTWYEESLFRDKCYRTILDTLHRLDYGPLYNVSLNQLVYPQTLQTIDKLVRLYEPYNDVMFDYLTFGLWVIYYSSVSSIGLSHRRSKNGHPGYLISKHLSTMVRRVIECIRFR